MITNARYNFNGLNPPVLYFGDLNEKHNINPKQLADFNTWGINSTQLKNSYNELIKLEDIDDDIFPFKLLLLSSDDEEILEFHLKILSENSDEYLRRDLFVFPLIEKIRILLESFYTENTEKA